MPATDAIEIAVTENRVDGTASFAYRSISGLVRGVLASLAISRIKWAYGIAGFGLQRQAACRSGLAQEAVSFRLL